MRKGSRGLYMERIQGTERDGRNNVVNMGHGVWLAGGILCHWVFINGMADLDIIVSNTVQIPSHDPIP
jgi:hypothetical protein